MFPALEDIETEKLVAELERRKTEHMPDAVATALRLVHSYHPEVCGVIYSGDIWLFVDKNRNAPMTFLVPNEKVPILEDALDAVYTINGGWCEFFFT